MSLFKCFKMDLANRRERRAAAHKQRIVSLAGIMEFNYENTARFGNRTKK